MADATVGVRVPETRLVEIRAHAEGQGKTVSAWVLGLIDQAMAAAEEDGRRVLSQLNPAEPTYCSECGAKAEMRYGSPIPPFSPPVFAEKDRKLLGRHLDEEGAARHWHSIAAKARARVPEVARLPDKTFAKLSELLLEAHSNGRIHA